MTCWFTRPSQIALLLALSHCVAFQAEAADFTVPAGTTDNVAKTVSGADRGLIETGATLSAATAITQSGAATDVVITNRGTIAGTRGLDTGGSSTARTITLNNQGSVTTSNDSVRINTALTSGGVTIDNTGTMTSTGGQVLDLSALTTTAPNSAAVGVTITTRGTINATADDAMRIGGGAVSIVNSGTINATGRAIQLNYGTNVSSFKLVNGVGGTISSTDDAVRITAVPLVGTVVVENRGTITSTGDGQAIDFDNVRATSVLIQNYGTMQSTDADGVRAGVGGVVENWGTITGRAIDPNDSSDGVDFQNRTGGVVRNFAGTISGTRHGITGEQVTSITNEAGASIIGRNGSGINFDTPVAQGPMTVTNYGEIIGRFNPDADYGDGDGVDIDALGNIYNYGKILGEGSKGTKEGDLQPATSEAIAIGGGIIVNGSAAYRSALISGVDNGILVDDSETGPAFAAIDITNWGTVEGLDGYGIRIVSEDDNRIENRGTISGSNGVAVEFGAGDDLFVYHDGSEVEGYVTGGVGTDTFRLAVADAAAEFDVSLLGDDAAYRAFETFDIAAGGQWTLDGTSSFEGKTTITDAQVRLNDAGLSASAVTLTGSELSGGGVLGSLQLVDSSIGSFGIDGAPGVLDVAGNVSFDAGSSLVVNVRGTADRLVSGGAVSIADSASLVVQGTSGCATQAPCTIVSTEDGITGSFIVDNQLAFLDADVSYTGTDALLALSRNGASFESVGLTPNQGSVGGALDFAGSGSAIYDEIVGFTEAGAREAFDQLAGDAFASQANAMKWQELEFADALLARTRGALAARAGTGAALGYAAPTRMPEPFREEAASGPLYGPWVQGTGGRVTLDGNGNAGELASTYAGIVGGVDAVWDRFSFGVAGGYQNSRSEVDSRDSEIEADTGRIALYGAGQFNAVRLSAGGSFGFSSYESERTISVGDIDETASGSFDGNSGSVFAEAGYAMALGGAKVEPFAGVTWTRVETDGFDETDAALAGLSVGDIEDSSTFTTLGVRVAKEYAMSDGVFVPSASLAWRHAFDNDPVSVGMTFLDTGAGFTVEGLPLGEDSVLVNAGLDLELASGLSLGLSYQGQFSDEGTSHTGRGVASYRF